ncbi:MAG: ABC transporter ATP-binding protein [Saccharofermentanales bacterium]|jgi:ATP-binding cassette subfamily B protein
MKKEQDIMNGRDRRKVMHWIFKTVHAIDPNCIPLHLIRAVVAVVAIYLPIIGLKYILDAAFAADWSRLLITGIIVYGSTCLVQMLDRYLLYKATMLRQTINEKIMIDLKSHAMEIDYETVTSPRHKASLQAALNNMTLEVGDFSMFIKRAVNGLQEIISIATSLVLTLTLIFSMPKKIPTSGVLAWMVRPWPTLLVAVVALLIGLLFNRCMAAYGYRVKRVYLKNHAKVESQLEYYILEISGAKDRYGMYQNYDMLPMLSRHVNENGQKSRQFFEKTYRAHNTINGGESVLFGIVLLTGYGIAAMKALTLAIPMSALLTYARAYVQMLTSFSELTFLVRDLRHSLLYFKDIKAYAELPNKLATGSIPVEKRRDHALTLTLENVSFRYPGTDVDVLKNVSLTFDMNQRHALVGPNGAGKSSLIYLLCRLYDPTEGRILLNGVDIRKYDYDEYLSLFSVVFQDFQLFAFPVAENVALSDTYDSEEVLRNLERAGYDPPEDPEAFLQKTVMDMLTATPQFSGGEQQKIAIARALQKDASFVILDEPTAALDAKAEAEIYEHLQNLIEDKTTIFISHRMSSCRLCEDIIVLDAGEVVERGTHHELLDRAGLYRDMWEAQAQYYR